MTGLLSKRVERCAAVPGVLLPIVLAVIALAVSRQLAVSIGDRAIPVISPVLLGIVLGITWRNLVGLGPDIQRGVEWVLETLLRAGIALVGLRLTLDGLAAAGSIAVPVVVSCIGIALLVSALVGRALDVAPSMRQLLAIGTAVCGCTAIIVSARSIGARPAETSTALTCVVMLGSIGMVLYPWVAEAVFSGAALPIGVFLGSAIHDTSQVMGAALIYSQQIGPDDVVEIASATKLFRNLSIIVLVPLMEWSTARASANVHGGEEAAMSGRTRIIPAFVVWFVVLVLLRAVGDRVFADGRGAEQLWHGALQSSQLLSELLLVCGMTAVGLSVVLSDMLRIGSRAVITALSVALATASYSLGLTYILVECL